MVIIKLIIYLLSLLIPGYFLVSLLVRDRKLPFALTLSLAYGVGSFFVTMQLFVWMFIFRLSFSWVLYLVLFVETVILVRLCQVGGRRPIASRGLRIKHYVHTAARGILSLRPRMTEGVGRPTQRRSRTAEIVMITLIALQLVFLVSNALARPTITYDAINIWAHRAKILYYENEVNFTPDHFHYLGGRWHNNYPWHVPLVQFWFHKIIGEYNDALVNLVFALYYLALLLAVYGFLRKYVSRFRSLLFTFFLSSMPLVFYHGFNAYADLTLSYYTFIAFGWLHEYLYDHDPAGQHKYLTAAALFSGMALFVKLEGVIFLAAGIIVLAVFRLLLRETWVKPVAYYTGLALSAALPWIAFNLIYGLGFSNTAPGLVWHPEILKNALIVMFISNSCNIWWFIVVLALIISHKRIAGDRHLLAGWAFLGCTFLGFMLVFIFTHNYRYALDFTAIGRNIMALTPISVFLAGVTITSNKS